MERDWNSQEYRKWRTAVYQRDKHRCRLCGSRKRLNAHHIKRWADYPTLRYSVSNGITLCRLCHGKVRNQEQEYELLFSRMISRRDGYIAIQCLIRKQENGESQGPQAQT